MVTTVEVELVAKKKTAGAKAQGTLVRVSDEFHRVLTDASKFEGMSVAQYADAYLLPIVRKRYRDSVVKEARRLEGGDR